MSNDQSHVRIIIEERYVYDATIGMGQELQVGESQAEFRVEVPFNGEAWPAASAEANLGEVVLSVPGGTPATHALAIRLPLGEAVQRAKNGEQAVWRKSYPLPNPRDTLVAIEGEVFDGTDIEDFAADRVFGHAAVFANDLRLRLSLWVPNFTSQTTFDDADQKLRDLLLEQESNMQVFLPDVGQADLLARSFCALANTVGGRVILGVDRSGRVLGVPAATTREVLERQLLLAALQCSPPVQITLPIELIASPESANESARTVVVVGVNHSPSGNHSVRGVVYRRKDGTTIGAASNRAVARQEGTVRPASNVREALAGGNSTSVMILDAHGEDMAQVQLGQAICGLLNAGARQSLVVVRGVAVKEQGGLSSTVSRLTGGRVGGGGGLAQQAQARLDAEMRHIQPYLGSLNVNVTTIETERMVSISVPGSLAPVALYKETGYIWQGESLQTLTTQDLLARYLQRVGGQALRTSTMQAEVEQAQLRWPVQPPSALKTGELEDDRLVDTYTYDPQQRSVVWRNQRFNERAGTNGLECKLTTRLRQAFIDLDSGMATNGHSDRRGWPPLTGQVSIRIDQALASGTTVEVRGTDGLPHPLLASASIIRRTFIVVNLSVQAHQLFKRRPRTLLLHTRLPDVSFGSERAERVADLRQAIADTGFWIYETQTLPDEHDGRATIVLRGVRSTGFHDIRILVGIRYEPNTLTRELRYRQRIDSKAIETGQLEARVLMWGSGEEARIELAKLQLQLSNLIEDRLHYLRSE